jgi:5-formyltetrahydrofolate cyclo-ligase
VGATPGGTGGDAKRALRSSLLAARARLAPEERLRRAERISERLAELPALRGAGTVALYAALGAEVPSDPLLARVTALGARVVLPRIAAARLLSFAACAPGELVPGRSGAREPPPSAREVPGAEIDVFVVPGVAFAEDGARLGRGGGFYDATLVAFPRAVRVGVGFDLQLVPELPRESHDVLMDAIVTEERVLRLVRSSSLTPGRRAGDVTEP